MNTTPLSIGRLKMAVANKVFSSTHCPICQSTNLKIFKSNNYFFPSYSKAPEFYIYQLLLCDDCTVIFMDIFPDEKKLANYYNTEYRASQFRIKLKEKNIEPPIMIPWSGISFMRFMNFYQTVEHHVSSLKILQNDNIIDYGGYQGMWGYAMNQTYGCYPIIYDFNEAGINFSKNAFGFARSMVAKDIYTDIFSCKAKLASLIHAFEHLLYPVKFLTHLKENILEKNGYLYIEVPNAYAFAHADPTHAFTYNTYSLERVLNVCGFEVLHIREDGFPKLEDGHDNDRMNLICLARATSEQPKTIKQLTQKPLNLQKEILWNYQKLTWKIMLNRYKNIFVSIVRNIAVTFLLILSPLLGYEKIYNFKASVKKLFK